MLDIKPEINVNISGKMGGKLTREVYKDAAKPFAKEFGKTGALAGKTINMLLSPLAATVWGYEKIKEVRQKKKLSEKLSEVPEAELQTPKANIAVPIVEAIRTVSEEESLQDMYIELLAKAMDKRTAYGVLPGFPEIIKQLSSDEAKLLKYIATTNFLPIVAVDFMDYPPNYQGRPRDMQPGEPFNGSDESDLFNGFMPIGPAKRVIRKFNVFGKKCGLAYPALSAAYLENLQRLGLIEINEDRSYAETEIYRETESDQLLTDGIIGFKRAFPNNYYLFQRGLVSLSFFGRYFCASCGILPPSQTIEARSQDPDAEVRDKEADNHEAK